MNVTLCSAFRDSAGYLDRYLDQVRGLDYALNARDDALTCLWGEGDSIDGTHYRLLRWIVSRLVDARVVDVSHGGKYHGNVVNADRFAQLAYVWGRIWERIPADSDAVLFVESDLIWEAETLVALVDRLQDYPAIAPLVMDGPDSFHDTWAFRLGGEQFTKARPFHPALGCDIMQLDSAGSCLAIRGDLARRLTWPRADVVVGLCAQIYRLGGSVWLDSSLQAVHP